jgi:hypothetical protein
MKVSAANQTLILANDGPAVGKAAASVSQSSRSSSNGDSSSAALQRVTVVAELPDSTVVTVHADYASRGQAVDSAANNADRVVSSQTPSAAQYSDSDIDALLASRTTTGALTAPVGTNTTASTSASASSLVQMSAPAYNSLLRGSDNSRDTAGNPHSSNENVALYARTERTTGATRTSSLVDVHA